MYSTMTTNRCSGPVRNNKEMRCSQRSKEEGGGGGGETLINCLKYETE